jgi:O-antigen ligase
MPSSETIPAVGRVQGPASSTLASMLPFAVALVPVLGLAAAQGGYFPTSWGWASVPLLWVGAIALAVRDRVRLNRFERVFLGSLVGLAAWIALSISWTAAVGPTVVELERVLVYVAVVSAALLLARGRHARHLLGGVLAAIALICTFSLLTRLVPDRIGVFDGTAIYRLAQPIGYWNGLGLFAAMGALIALGFAARARTPLVRAAAGAILVVFPLTLYFTFGRGAWLALAAGVVAAIAFDPRRLQLIFSALVLGPLPAVAVWAASRERGLTHGGTALVTAAHDGHRIAVVVLALAAGNAVVSFALAHASSRISISPALRLGFSALVVLGVLAAAGVVFGRYGDPATIARHAYASFKAPPPQVQGNLNRRLLSFSGNGRADLWRIAWSDAKRHPLLGSGPGTYERYFLLHQPLDVGRVRDAHGLYVETLAELGPFGLALLVATLLTPLVAMKAARRHPLAPAAAGAYVAYLVHTGVDWDWELAAVTLAGLVCGASILLFGRRWRPPQPLGTATRWVASGVAVAAAFFAALALVGEAALSRSAAARERGEPIRAANAADRAQTLMPWSPRPWQALGRAQLAAGFPAEARRSFRKAIAKDPGDWQIWYDLARATHGRAQRLALTHAQALIPRAHLISRGTAG